MNNKLKKEIISWILVLVVAFVLAKLITTFVFEKVTTPTGSMETTIMIDDRMLMNKLAYLFSGPKRGDIVVFNHPDGTGERLLKRVIGLPNDVLEIKDGHVFINGSELKEDYVHGQYTDSYGIEKYVIPENCYFMMGDNRNNSEDARSWENHFVNRKDIIGKVFLRYSPSMNWLK